MRPQVGQVINNKYRLIRVIGDGGMGSVYEARHEVLATTVALKFLHPELSRRSGLVQRFLQEARVSAHIHSPHVVRVTDVDQTSAGLAFIVMEYLEGQTLQALYEDLYRAGRQLSYADALDYAMQILEGVEAAHRAGIVHRDLKPDNVMITRGPKGAPLIKLLDFGIAKLKVTGELDRGLTRPGVIMGTPEYMAPEQAYSADAVDSRADIFSLGVMIFEMLAGRRPVGGDEATMIASQYIQGHIAQLTELAPHVSPMLALAIHRAMAPMSKDRFDTVADFRAAIEPFARAINAPSVVGSVPPAAQLSPVAAAISPGTPATNAPADERRGVPKTLPPEDDERHGNAPIAAPGVATPLGGFSRPEGTSSNPSLDRPESAPPGGAFAAPHYGEGGRPRTGEPVVIGLPPTADPPFSPLGEQQVAGLPATEDYVPVEMSPRPGGTAVSALPPFNGSGPPFEAAYGTAAMSPLTAAPTPAPPMPRKRSGGGSLLLVLLLASGVAGAVVGGVYIAHEYAKPEDKRDDPPAVALPPSTQVTTPSPPTGEPPPATAATPTPPPPVTAKPPIKPTATAKPTSTPTASPTAKPTGIGPPILPGPISLPSAIPFPFPLPGGPTAGPPPSTGQNPPPPGTTPPPAGSGSGRPRIVIKVPKAGN